MLRNKSMIFDIGRVFLDVNCMLYIALFVTIQVGTGGQRHRGAKAQRKNENI